MNLPDALIDAFLTFAGLAGGSFIGVVADRVPRGEQVIRGRSRCRACNSVLGPIDLLPIAGYLLRRGRCAHCGARFSGSWAVVEAGCGMLVLCPSLVLGPLIGGAVGLALLTAAVIVVWTVSMRRRLREN